MEARLGRNVGCYSGVRNVIALTVIPRILQEVANARDGNLMVDTLQCGLVPWVLYSTLAADTVFVVLY